MGSAANGRVIMSLVDVNNYIEDTPTATTSEEPRKSMSKKRVMVKTLEGTSKMRSGGRQSSPQSYLDEATAFKTTQLTKKINVRASGLTGDVAWPSGSRLRRDKRHALRIERLKIAEKLSCARPDLVAPTYAAKRMRLLASRIKFEAREQYVAGIRTLTQVHNKGDSGADDHDNAKLTFEMVKGDNDRVDWDRSRELAETVQEEIRRGGRAGNVLPPLVGLLHN